jgi:D-alanyl-D-alanine carboxypeptidase
MLPSIPNGYEARMPRCEEARDLRSVGSDSSGRDALLAPRAADAWLSMRQAAEQEGVRLLLVSAFRSIAQQRAILQAKLASGLSWADILVVNAYPGFSEHHTGRAIDVGTPEDKGLSEAFEATKQFAWLSSNAGRFRFFLSYPRGNRFGIAYEPWHWCFA